MELIVVGSGSKGNCYVLHNGSEALVLEAGVPYADVCKAVGREVAKMIKMVLVTHEHQDHAKYVKEWLEHGIRVWCTPGTAAAIKRRHSRTRVWCMQPQGFAPRLAPGDVCKWTGMQGPVGISILPFATVHDADEPCGFILNEKTMGNLVFATDTAFIPSRISRLSHIMIECNYDEHLLAERTDIPEKLKDRIRDSHMSVTSCIEALQANDLGTVQNIILMHISEGDGDAEAFKGRVEREFGINTKVAEKGLKMALQCAPF